MYSFEYIGKPVKKEDQEAIFALLCECDQDFVPPLSYRSSSSQSAFDLDKSDDKPYAYFEEILKQLFVVARDENGEMVAFLTFKHGYTCAELEAYVPANYMSTACVSHAHRRKGLVSQLYQMVEAGLPEAIKAAYTTTRTWSTNTAQVHAFPKRGYELVFIKKDDRGPGVDTFYYARDNKQ